jgi:hypothetical protein
MIVVHSQEYKIQKLQWKFEVNSSNAF